MTKEQRFGKWLSRACFALTAFIIIWIVWGQTYPQTVCERIWSSAVKPIQSIKQTRLRFIKACTDAEIINQCSDGYIEAGSHKLNCIQHGGIESILKQPDG